MQLAQFLLSFMKITMVMVNIECDAAILVETAARWDGAPQWYPGSKSTTETIKSTTKCNKRLYSRVTLLVHSFEQENGN